MKKFFFTPLLLALIPALAPAQEYAWAMTNQVKHAIPTATAAPSVPEEPSAEMPAATPFPADLLSTGISLSLEQNTANFLRIAISGSNDAEFRAVLIDNHGDIAATRTITGNYEWDLLFQQPGEYQLSILSKKDGTLLARRKFIRQ